MVVNPGIYFIILLSTSQVNMCQPLEKQGFKIMCFCHYEAYSKIQKNGH